MQKHCLRVILYNCYTDKPICAIFSCRFKNMVVVAVMKDAGESTLAADVRYHFTTVNNDDVFNDMDDLDFSGIFWQCPECGGKNVSGWFFPNSEILFDFNEGF